MIETTRGLGFVRTMRPELLLALDQGTTSSKALVMDHEGTVLGRAQHELPASYPSPGWVEQDPEAIWQGQLAAATEALGNAGITSRDLAGIGVSNQRETTVVWDRATGEPVSPAIVWQDRRTAPLIGKWVEAGLGDTITRITGLVADPYFSASKIRWILDNVPEARERAEAGNLAFGTVDSWLLFRLTGGSVHATDVTNASRTMLYDTSRLEWSAELLQAFRIPASLLPEVRDTVAHFGDTDPSLLGRSIPIYALAGDQHASLFGQACFEPGMAKCTYGTGCFMVQNTGAIRKASPDRLLSTLAWSLPGRFGGVSYALEGSVFVAGSAVQWLRDGLGLIREASEVNDLAGSVSDSGGVWFVPAFAGLGAPHWDPHARGAILGLTRGSTAGHVARAALEGIALQVADVFNVLAGAGGHAPIEIRADGGGARSSLLMQLQADSLGVPVVRSATDEATAMGAAFLAGLGAGVFRGLDEVGALWQAAETFEPRISDSRREEWIDRWHDAVSRAAAWESPG